MPGSGENKSDKSRVNMAWHQIVVMITKGIEKDILFVFKDVVGNVLDHLLFILSKLVFLKQKTFCQLFHNGPDPFLHIEYNFRSDSPRKTKNEQKTKRSSL